MKNEKIINEVKNTQNRIVKIALDDLIESAKNLNSRINVNDMTNEQLDEIKFLNENIKQIEGILKSYKITQSNECIKVRNIFDSLEGTKPKFIKLAGETPIEISAHKESLVEVSKWMYKKDRDKFLNKVIPAMGALFGDDSVSTPKLIAENIYVSTQRGCVDIYKKIQKMVKIFGLDSNEIEITIY